jgi:hypothetical protein
MGKCMVTYYIYLVLRSEDGPATTPLFGLLYLSVKKL